MKAPRCAGILVLYTILLIGFSVPAFAIEKRETNTVEIRRAYVDGPFGQIHLAVARPKDATKNLNTPLVLFHPTPYSSDFYRQYMLDLGNERTVIAMDTPGYGYSDRPGQPATMAELAQAAEAAITALDLSLVDVGGYHTGALIAIELAIQRPDLVRRLALSGVPYYVGDEREEAYAKNVKPHEILEDGSHLSGLWRFAVTERTEGVTLERAAEHYSDALLAGNHEWWAYKAVFSYEAEKRLPLVKQAVVILNSHAGLKEHSQAAAVVLPNATLIELPHMKHGIFDIAAEELAALTREFLDRP